MDPINPLAGNPEALNQTAPLPPRSNKVTIVALVLLFLILLGSTVLLAYQNMQLTEEIAGLSKPIPSPTPIITLDPTANWKTYTNTVHNLTFRYPPSWAVDPRSNDTDALNATLIIKRDNATITMIFKLNGIGGAGRDFTGTPYSLSGLPLYLYTITNSYDHTLAVGLTDSLTQSLGVFEYQGNPYSIMLTYPDAIAGSQNEKDLLTEYRKILSTFTFTGGTAPTPTCRPRPACLDATPRCMIPETSDMCPKASPTPSTNSCNTSADCPTGSQCMTAGPIIYGQPEHKICVKSGQVIPL